MQAAEMRAQMPSGSVSQRSTGVALNDINVEISGGLVRISALLDAKGLDKLRRKIEALQTLIEDEDANPLVGYEDRGEIDNEEKP